MRIVILGMVFCFAVSLAGCGGTGPTGGTRAFKVGRVYVKNETPLIVDVFYKDEDQGRIDTTINPGETEEVTRRVLEGRTKITLNINPRRNCRSDVEVDVVIDGNRTVRVIRVGACGTKEVETIII